MAHGRKFEVSFMDEVQEFLDILDDAPRDKIVYNVHKVACGVIDNDLFKKLDGSDGIWEFRTKYNGMEYLPPFGVLGRAGEAAGGCHSWIC